MFMDRELSCRLERVEGVVGVTFSEVNRARGAVSQNFDGTYAFFDGVDSPLTQTFGLGMSAVVTLERLTPIEAFFTERGAEVMHEVSPLAGVEAIALLAERGYRPHELSTVLVKQLDGSLEAPAVPGLRARTTESADRDAWIETSIQGWSADPTYGDLMRTIATAAFANHAMVHFLVEREGQAIATGSMAVVDDIALRGTIRGARARCADAAAHRVSSRPAARLHDRDDGRQSAARLSATPSAAAFASRTRARSGGSLAAPSYCDAEQLL
jgi:hypothetical protein